MYFLRFQNIFVQVSKYIRLDYVEYVHLLHFGAQVIRNQGIFLQIIKRILQILKHFCTDSKTYLSRLRGICTPGSLENQSNYKASCRKDSMQENLPRDIFRTNRGQVFCFWELNMKSN